MQSKQKEQRTMHFGIDGQKAISIVLFTVSKEHSCLHAQLIQSLNAYIVVFRLEHNNEKQKIILTCCTACIGR